MVVTVLDAEWGITRKSFTSKTSGKLTERIDGLPYEINNELVSVGYTTSDGETEYHILNNKHLEQTPEERREKYTRIQEVLNKTDLLVAHNVVSDLQWLLESGFTYDGAVYDTMIFEYVYMKGKKGKLKLGDCCKRRKVKAKFKDMLREHMDAGGRVYDWEPENLIKYGRDDVQITKKLYKAQLKMIKEKTEIQSMLPVLKVMNQFALVLVDMGRNGFKIDEEALSKLETQYRRKYAARRRKINERFIDFMGHTPVNMNAPEQLSQVLYGFKVIDKKAWSEYFNTGTEKEGPRKGKKRYPHKRTSSEVAFAMRKWGKALYKTVAHECNGDCDGEGYIQKIKKDGTPWKNKTKCPHCEGSGYIYKNTKERAGLGVAVPGYQFASAGGFSAGKDAIEYLLEHRDLSKENKKFLQLLEEYSAIKVYLGSFIEGIQKQVMSNGLLHMQYNQCVTATGRLSSTFHNLPRGDTFPIKGTIRSRWEGGKIINADFASLEFRVAALLSQDEVAMKDIKDKVDVHTQTATFMTKVGQKTNRQDAKEHTFKPLFGGTMGTKPEQRYYKWFLQRYAGINKWQQGLGQQAISRKQIQSPSGRVYGFPYAKPLSNGRVVGFTQICNYEVQGFSFDGPVMLLMIALLEEYRKIKLKSKLIVTVHDSCPTDCYPGEEDEVISAYRRVATALPSLVERAYKLGDYGIDEGCNVALPLDLSIGDNWLEQKDIEFDNAEEAA